MATVPSRAQQLRLHLRVALSDESEARVEAARERRAHRLGRSSLGWVEPLRSDDPDETGIVARDPDARFDEAATS